LNIDQVVAFQRNLMKVLELALKQARSAVFPSNGEFQAFIIGRRSMNGFTTYHKAHWDASVDGIPSTIPLFSLIYGPFRHIEGGWLKIGDFAQWFYDTKGRKRCSLYPSKKLRDYLPKFDAQSKPYEVTVDWVDPVNDYPVMIVNNNAQHGGPVHSVSSIQDTGERPHRPVRGVWLFSKNT
jgi:hypothetical protein